MNWLAQNNIPVYQREISFVTEGDHFDLIIQIKEMKNTDR